VVNVALDDHNEVLGETEAAYLDVADAVGTLGDAWGRELRALDLVDTMGINEATSYIRKKFRDELGEILNINTYLEGGGYETYTVFDEIFNKLQEKSGEHGWDWVKDNAATLVKNFVQGLRDQGHTIDDALFDWIKDYVSAYLELHSPAKKGPLSTVDRWWRPMGGELMKGARGGLRGLERLGREAAGMVGGGFPGAALAPSPVYIHAPTTHITPSDRGEPRGRSVTYNINIYGYTAEESKKIARAVSRRLELLKD